MLHHGMSDKIRNSIIENAPAIASQLTDDFIKEVLEELESDRLKETEQISTKDSFPNKVLVDTINDQKPVLPEKSNKEIILIILNYLLPEKVEKS